MSTETKKWLEEERKQLHAYLARAAANNVLHEKMRDKAVVLCRFACKPERRRWRRSRFEQWMRA